MGIVICHCNRCRINFEGYTCPACEGQCWPVKNIPTAEAKQVAEVPGGIPTHEELARKTGRWCRGVKEGRWVGNMMVLGRAGTGKSELITAALTRTFGPQGQGWMLVKQGTQPASAHQILYEANDKPLYLDDPKKVFAQPIGRDWLLDLLESKRERVVDYGTKEMRHKGVGRLVTRSPVIISSNTYISPESDLGAAIRSRLEPEDFNPSGLQVHLYSASWFWHQPVYDKIAEYLPHIPNLTCRLYVRCWEEERRDPHGWETLIHQAAWGDDRERWMACLKEVQKKDHRSDREIAMTLENKRYGWGWRQLERVLQDIRQRAALTQVPRILVQGQPPQG
jgi:hypothetical protein